MEKKIRINIFSILFILFIVSSLTGFSQVDSLHYIPPMCTFNNSDAVNHQMVLTTSETEEFTVTITNKDGSFLRTVLLSSADPQKINLNYTTYSDVGSNTLTNGVDAQGVISVSDLNTHLNTEGLIVSGPKKFFVSIQQKSGSQGDLLTSKGTTGLGTDFYSGHMFSAAGGFDALNGHFIGVMATENNTNITISNPRVHFKNQPNTFTIRLNKGESYVVGIRITDLKTQTSNLNDVNGTHISSNKPIAVNSGSWCASGNLSNSPGRDIGFDQLVPTDVVGEEYILIKGEGTTEGGSKPWAKVNERATIIATENDTKVTYYYRYESKTKKTEIELEKGEYYITGEDEMVNSELGNMYIKADQKIFVYQTLSGANERQTAGFCFIPPLKCTADKEVTIAFTNELAGSSVDAVLKLITQKNCTVTLNDVTLSHSFRKNVRGNKYWQTYDIPNSELINPKYNSGDNSIFKIESTGALNAMLAIRSGNVGGGGYFSGFGDVPQVNQSPSVLEQGLCGDNVKLTATGFDSYNWYKNGELIPGEHDAIFLPSNPGRYKVTGRSPCGGSTTESFPSNEIRIRPCLSINPASIEVTEGTTYAIFTVKLSHIWPESDNIDVTFDYETNGGTATSGIDYALTSGIGAKIESGQDSFEIKVLITDDNLNEDDENFTLTISNVVEAVENITVGTATIKDDNDPMPTITVTDQTYNEDAGTVNLSVNLSTASGKIVTADYSILDNTASQTDDYTATNYSGSLIFAPGDLSKTISLSIVDDAIYEPGADEYFTVQLSSLVNTTAGNTSANISIIDNETPPEINVVDVSKTEGTSIVFQANLSHPADETISFNYAIALSNGPGNAKQQDFINYLNFSTDTITIPAGDTSVDFPAFLTEDDNANEGAEVFTVNFTSASNATLGDTSATGTILDNEGNPTLSIADASATEGDALSFIISVSPIKNSDIVFQYRTIDGTATSSDFDEADWTSITFPANSSSMTLSIATTQDTEEEGIETFMVEIGNTPKKVDLAADPETATGTIIDDDDTPVAKDDTYSVNEDATLSGENVMNNDLGLSDVPVTVTSHTDPANGSLSMNTDGSFTYTPTANYNGSDSFDYTIQDVDGDTSSATVTITVNSVNDLPIANDDLYTIDEDTQLSNDVTSNDENLFDLPITISLVSDVRDGTLTLNADGSFSYMPDSEFFGTDNFTYQLTDGNNEAVQAVVTINVTFINDAAPVAVDDEIATNEDTDVVVDVLANDYDVDGNQTIDKATVFIKTDPLHGDLSQDNETGKVTYVPDLNYDGVDSFTYTIQDESGLISNIATVTINVIVDNDPPVAKCKSGVIIYLNEMGSYTLDPSEINDSSYDIENGSNVILSVSPNTFICDDKGSIPVTLTVKDQDGLIETCSTNITVVDNSLPSVKTAQENISKITDAGNCSTTVIYTVPIFTDNCDGDQTGTLIAGASSGSSFDVGTTTVTYEYTDASGNGPVQSSFTVTVTDTQKPVFNNTSNQNFTPNKSGCEYLVNGTLYDVTATDNCGIQSFSHNYDGGGSSLNNKSFPLGTTDVIWTAEDIHNNIISTVVQVTVSTDLSVSLSGPAGNEICEGEDAIFTATASGGDPAYLYQFFVDNTKQTTGVSGNTFTTSTLVDGDKVTTRITDKFGCSVTSSEIVMIIHPKPAPIGIFFED